MQIPGRHGHAGIQCFPSQAEQASRSEHASNLIEGPSDVLDEPESICRERDVEARISQHGKIFDVRFDESDTDFLRFRKGPRMGELSDEKSTPVTRAPCSARCTADCPPPQAISRISFPARSEPRIFNSRSGGMDGPHSTSSSSSPRWVVW